MRIGRIIDIGIAVLLLCVACLFFLPLFVPELKLFVTPDSNLSDILHFNYPLKFLLSQALKQHSLPLWTDLIGTGFPLIGEAEIGAFSLVNLILFYFFPMPVAFNLGYIVTFTFFGWGMYAVGRELGWKKSIAFLVSIIYMFNGFHIVQIPHYDHLQTLSYMPFIFWIILRMKTNSNTRLWIVLPFLISQQIFQGHYQYVFITWVFIFLYWFFCGKKQNKLFIACILGIGIAAIQLIPSFEFFRLSDRSMAIELYEQTKSGGLSFIHFFQFLYPYILGDVRRGTFPTTYNLSFWEMFSYIGIIPFLIAVWSIAYVKKYRSIRSLWIVIIILILLSIEVNTPLYLIFYFPPLSWFRIHSRFLSVVTFTLLLAVGWFVQTIGKKWNTYGHITIRILLVVGCIDVLYFASTYHPTLPVSQLSKPALYPSTNERMTSIGVTKTWFNYMNTYGWKSMYDYMYLLNAGTPNYPSVFHQPSIQFYSGFTLKKQSTLYAFTLQGDIDNTNKIATLSASILTILKLHATPYILTPYTITNGELIEDAVLSSSQTIGPLRRYRLPEVKPMYYYAYHATYIPTLEQFTDILKNPEILHTTDAFVHAKEPFPLINKNDSEKPTDTISVISDSSTKKTFSLHVEEPTLFIASLYLYPGWEASIDGVKTPIYPANLSGMAITIPKGNHNLMLVYTPTSLYIGGIISTVAIALYICLILFLSR